MLYLSLAFFLSLSCQTRHKVEPSELIGRWKVIGALREGRSTNTINGAYFNFIKDTLVTNFTGKSEVLPVRLENNKLIIESSLFREMEIKFESDTVLMLSANIQSVNFTFSLQRENDGEE